MKAILVGLTASVLSLTGCNSASRSAEAGTSEPTPASQTVSEPGELSGIPVKWVRRNSNGSVAMFRPAAPPAPGVSLPPPYVGLEYVTFNNRGELIGWKLAE